MSIFSMLHASSFVSPSKRTSCSKLSQPYFFIADHRCLLFLYPCPSHPVLLTRSFFDVIPMYAFPFGDVCLYTIHIFVYLARKLAIKRQANKVRFFACRELPYACHDSLFCWCYSPIFIHYEALTSRAVMEFSVALATYALQV